VFSEPAQPDCRVKEVYNSIDNFVRQPPSVKNNEGMIPNHRVNETKMLLILYIN
jgi:hypothetical protein